MRNAAPVLVVWNLHGRGNDGEPQQQCDQTAQFGDDGRIRIPAVTVPVDLQGILFLAT